MATNQEKLDGLFWHVTEEGRAFDARYAFSELKFPNAWGDNFPLLTIINGIERRQAEQNAIATSLIAALAAVTKGEAFDEAKLLAGVEAAAERGAGKAIDSITVTVEGK